MVTEHFVTEGNDGGYVQADSTRQATAFGVSPELLTAFAESLGIKTDLQRNQYHESGLIQPE
ncbi:hypothetical protein F2Q69_00055726 [Brassica cretica]|uniref:Uncharacterized protein n=1 Tax=Brassica cretica TaxID=69181 RepID=A0A8S9MSW8_BRACR|nr:hypothetical protein F2Q69_00055726 [Brassica cretica]